MIFSGGTGANLNRDDSKKKESHVKSRKEGGGEYKKGTASVGSEKGKINSGPSTKEKERTRNRERSPSPERERKWGWSTYGGRQEKKGKFEKKLRTPHKAWGKRRCKRKRGKKLSQHLSDKGRLVRASVSRPRRGGESRNNRASLGKKRRLRM